VLQQVVSHWLTKIEGAKQHKRKVYQMAADECMGFYNGPKSWDDLMWGETGGQAQDNIDPMFKVSVNKTFEFVTIFGPVLYAENPVRTVKPRMPVVIPPDFFPDPMVYQSMIMEENQRVMVDGLRSVLLEAYLNWTPVEFRLNEQSRQAIEEALIKGRGVVWTELYTPPGTDMRVVRTFFDSTDNLQIDPDAESYERCTWVARRCIHPVWQVERDFGLRPGSLKGNVESQMKQSDIETSDDLQYDRKRGYTNDLLAYWKIYTKMGIGGRLNGMNPEYRGPLDMFGDYCYLAIADNCQFPLNLSPDITNNPELRASPQAIFARTAWPTPFWGDDEFPVTVLDFHKIPQCPWPLAHLKAGMGELKFLNWCMSFLMGKIRNTTRDFIAVLKQASEELKTAILEGRDLTLLEIDAEHKTITEVVQFLQHPAINGDIWKMIAAVEENFDKRVGLTELMYGNQGQTQIRSASEANLRTQAQSVRPDDMRHVVEAWMTRVAVKEAVCARYHLQAPDVSPVFGKMGAWAWTTYVSTRDVNEACRSLEYRIEAGSTQRPNKNWEAETMTTAFQSLMPVLQNYATATGDTVPMNNLLGDFAKSRDLDPNRYQLTATVPTQAPPPQGAPGHQSSATTNVPAPG
jgi:hypothetical protein